jgi:hypothetical protein
MKRELAPARPSIAEARTDDPLARLNALIERAHDLDADESSWALEPLASVYDKIERARSLEPTHSPEVEGADPVETIRTWIDAEVDEIGRREEPALRRTPVASAPHTAPNSLEAALGREVLAMVAEEPLSPTARSEAVTRLAEALDNPSETAVRQVLRVLIKG